MIIDPSAADLAYFREDQLTRGVMTRRVFAWIIDALLIGMIGTAVFAFCVFFGLITFGLGWPLFGIIPLVPLLYHWLTLASSMSASPGQMLLGLTVRHNDDLGPPSAMQALVFTVMLYVTFALGWVWMLVALITTRHRTFHDMLAGVVVVRARMLTRPSGDWNMGAPPYQGSARP